MRAGDTICAPATVPGSGAISIIRVSGSEALAIAGKVVRLRRGKLEDVPGYTFRLGEIPDVDQVMAAVFRAPKSYTGEDSVEIYCHASAWIAGRILEMLCTEGARMALPGEFTQRAYINGKMDLSQAEAVADLIAAGSEASHRVALNQLRGQYSLELKELRDKLVEMTSLMELELDFSEEDVEFASRTELETLLGTTIARVEKLAESFRAGNALKNGVPVAIVGPVNAGKSTLLNALVGDERAIVSPIAGTTRDTVEEVITIDGIQYRFIDTAGLRETTDYVEQKGVERSLTALSKADIVIGVVDGSTDGWKEEAAGIREKVSGEQTLILVRNKMDREDSSCGGSKAGTNVDSDANIDHGRDSGSEVGSGSGSGSGSGNGNGSGSRNGSGKGLTLGKNNGNGGAELEISAKEGNGLDKLRAAISDSQKDRFGSDAGTLVTSLRHHGALVSALGALKSVRSGLAGGIPTDLVAEDLRSAITSLNSIFGENIGVEDILGEIFGKFCIGK